MKRTLLERIAVVQTGMVACGIRAKAKCNLQPDGTVGPEHMKGHEWFVVYIDDNKKLYVGQRTKLAKALVEEGFVTTTQTPKTITNSQIMIGLGAVLEAGDVIKRIIAFQRFLAVDLDVNSLSGTKLVADGGIGPQHSKAHGWIYTAVGNPEKLVPHQVAALAAALNVNGFMTVTSEEATLDDIRNGLKAVIEAGVPVAADPEPAPVPAGLEEGAESIHDGDVPEGALAVAAEIPEN